MRQRIILASGSPRRKSLLKQIGLKFEVITSNHEEKINENNPRKLVEKLSLEKAMTVAEKIKNGIIIGADTVVVFKGKIIGKPKDKKDAIKILSLLSGKTSTIITGFSIIDVKNKKTIIKSVETKIKMRKLSLKEINGYIKKDNPLDNAGAFKIQDIGAVLVEKIEGDYFNVVGLPLCSLSEELKKFGVNILE